MVENPFSRMFKKPDTLTSEHLEKDSPPIMVQIIDSQQTLDTITEEAIRTIKKSGEDVNWEKFWNQVVIEDDQERRYALENAYLISSISAQNKYSEKYIDCTGVLAVGKSKESGENISFLSHQISSGNFPKSFPKKLELKITELKQKVLKGSIDIVVFGGDYSHQKEKNTLYTPAEEYAVAIRKTSETIRKAAGFDPVVIAGPNLNLGTHTHAYFDNTNRRLYIVRPTQRESLTNAAYRPKDIKKVSKDWSNQ